MSERSQSNEGQPASGSPWLHPRLEIRIGQFLFASVLLFYLLILPDYAVPDRWAMIASQFSGLDPFNTIMRPVWSGLAGLLAILPFKNIGLVFNITSAVTGAAACWFLYDIIRRISFDRGNKLARQIELERRARIVAGVTAALYAAVSLPVITVSTRGDYAMFNLLLVLLAVWPLLCFSQQRRVIFFHASCLLAGLAVADYPGMLFVLPFLFFRWAVVLYKWRMLRPGVVFAGVLLFITGLLVVLPYGVMLTNSPGSGLREIDSLDRILGLFFFNYYNELRHGVPKVGWLLLLAVNILPFVMVLFKELSEPTDKFSAIGVYLFRLILVVIGIVTLFDLPGSPGRVIEARFLLVAPSIIAAAWFGYLTGYYDLLMYGARSRRKQRPFVPAVVGLLILVAGVRHGVASQPAELDATQNFAADVINQIDDGTFLLSQGMLDDSLRLQAHASARSIFLLNYVQGNDPAYGRYHATLFSDPELQDMARLGVLPLMRDWFVRDTNIQNKITFMVAPDFLVPYGYVALPDRTVYRVHRTGEEPGATTLYQQNMDYWTSLQLPAFDLQLPSAMKVTLVWLSRMANDLGVYLQELGDDERAAASYEQSLGFWPDNFSAAINQLARARASGDAELVNVWETRVKEQVERNRTLLEVRGVGQLSGRLFGPAAMLEEATILGVAGRRADAAARMQRAAGLIDADDSGLQLSLARIHLQQRNLEASEKSFRELIERNPQDIEAHYGLLRVALNQGKFDMAQKQLEALEALDFDKDRLGLARAEWLMLQGQRNEAKEILLDLISRPSPLVDAWYQLGLVAMMSGDDELFSRAAEVLARQQGYMPGMLLLGEQALRKANPEEARLYLEKAALLDPGNLPVLERLFMIDYFERNTEALRVRTAAILAIDPDNTIGLYGAATVHIASGEYDLAVVPLRRCLEGSDYGPAHNDLAWILGQKGALDEALHHAGKAVQLMSDDPNALDTLATIQRLKGDVQAAADTMQRAVKDRPADVAMIFRAADLMIEAKRSTDASNVLARLEKSISMLPPETMQKLNDLQSRLKAMPH